LRQQVKKIVTQKFNPWKFLAAYISRNTYVAVSTATQEAAAEKVIYRWLKGDNQGAITILLQNYMIDFVEFPIVVIKSLIINTIICTFVGTASTLNQTHFVNIDAIE